MAALGLALMLGATVWQRLASPELVRHAAQAPAPSMQSMPEGMEGLDMDSAMGRLMREAGENPDPDTLFRTGVALISQGSWPQAVVFLEHARTMDVNNPDIPYYLGYAAHQMQEHEKAAALMEESLALSNRAAVHVSLANILRYWLHDEKRAMEHFAAALEAPDCSDDVREAVAVERARPAPAR